jgi:hypothetical protein
VETGGSAITDYQLEMDTWRSGKWAMVWDGTELPWPRRTTLTSPVVLAGTKYQFRVRALNVIGVSPASPVANFTIRAAETPFAPRAPVQDPQTSDGSTYGNDSIVAVTWAPPIDNGGAPITDYRVFVDDGRGGAFNPDAVSRFGVRIVSDRTAGTWSFVYNGRRSGDVVFSSGGTTLAGSVTAIRDAIESVLEDSEGVYGGGNTVVEVNVTVASSVTFDVTFFNPTGDIETLGIVETGASGGTGTTVTVVQDGVGQPEVHQVWTSCAATPMCTRGDIFSIGLNTLSGVFVLATNIPFSATAAQMQSAVETAFRSIAELNGTMNPPRVRVTTR